jgi:hypothetical protein
MVDDVRDGDVRSAAETSSEHHHAADGAAAGDQHPSAQEVAGTRGRMQRYRQGFGHREFLQRHVRRHRHALPLRHHEVLAEQALHMREDTGAAEEPHVQAEVLPTFPTGGAPTTPSRRIDGDPIARLHAQDALADRGDDAGGLVARGERLADPEAADTTVKVVMHVRAADTGSSEPDQHLAGLRIRHRYFQHPQVVGCIHFAFKHDRLQWHFTMRGAGPLRADPALGDLRLRRCVFVY